MRRPPARFAASRTSKSIRSTTRPSTRPPSSWASIARSGRRLPAGLRGPGADGQRRPHDVRPDACKAGKVRIYATNGTQGARGRRSRTRRSAARTTRRCSRRARRTRLCAKNDVQRERRPVLRHVRLLHRRSAGTTRTSSRPDGFPDTVFVIGSYTYGELGGRSNARAVLRSTTAGDPDAANGEPDVHRHDDGRRVQLDPSRRARAGLPAGQPERLVERLRRRGRPLERRLRRTSRPSAPNGRSAPRASSPATGCSRAVPTQHLQPERRPHDPAVPERVAEPAQPDRRADGRHAGQRHLVVHGQLEHVDADDLRRRRPVRLRRRQSRHPLQPVLQRVRRRELPRRRPDQVGHRDRADPEQRRGGWRSTGPRSPTRSSPGHDLHRLPERLADEGQRRRPGLPGGQLSRVHHVRRPRSGCGDFVALGGPAREPQRQRPDRSRCGYGAPAGRRRPARSRRADTADTHTLWAATATGRVFITKNADAEPAGRSH